MKRGLQININLSNKVFYSLIAIASLLIISGVAYAYHSGASPSVFGHSGEEIEVTLGGTTTTLNNALSSLSTSAMTSGEGASMSLPGTGTYTVLIQSSYFSCEDYQTTLKLDGTVVRTYTGKNEDTAGCNQNTIMGKITGVSAGSHTWSTSRGTQQQYLWIAIKE